MRRTVTGVVAGAVTTVAALTSLSNADETVTSGTSSMTLPRGLRATSAHLPEDHPMSGETIALGKLLFFDRRFSRDESVACASNHNPFHGFADSKRTSAGVGEKLGTRNSLAVTNWLFSADQAGVTASRSQMTSALATDSTTDRRATRGVP
jgi:cytochrome c peroxidase